MIPVLICPILNRRDLLDQMLASVDVPVERYVIIDNSTEGICGDLNGPRDAHSPHFQIEGAVVISPRHNLGVAASWNLGMKVTPLAPYWVIVGNDVRFAAGTLQRLVDAMEAATGPLFVAVGSFSLFAINAAALEKVGLFDEQYIPAYAEDNDLSWRIHLAGVERINQEPALFHETSSTINSDTHLSMENGRTFPQNIAYHRMKWGGPPHEEKFTTPFDRGGDIRAWTLDVERLRQLTWR